MRVRLQVSYDGTDYAGWQSQGPLSPDVRPTLQETMEGALSKVFASPIKVQASGRTDAGTHAEAQNLHFETPAGVDEQSLIQMKLLRSLNALTPDSIGINRAWIAPDRFHALRSSLKKTYEYRIHNSPTPNPLRARYSYWFKKPLDINKMNSLMECCLGTHDFKSFQTRGTELKTTVRMVEEAIWQHCPTSSNEVTFTITANGFLKQMVRNLVGTVIYLHQNDFGPLEMQKILAGCDRQLAKATAPAHGLTLKRVYYPPELDNECREI